VQHNIAPARKSCVKNGKEVKMGTYENAESVECAK
jgi:hypothetical protein